ncbi:alcohol dehydrogenase catalytic domain-containing protein [Gaiella sp.]|uniref:zinc-dependent alcohol dehydrogenase n=1 Tax=Gaiella sp. TaxID=2663207 RepID=UPI0032630E86
MRASVFAGPRDIRVTDLSDPTPCDGEIVVSVRAAGVCGGDLHEYRAGRQLYATPYPRPAQGHEVAGEVLTVGPNVHTVSPGDRVAIQPMVSCGACSRCAAGRWALCEKLEHIGVARPGGFAEQCVAPATNAFPLPEHVSFDEGALLDCTAVAVHAFARVPIPHDTDVVVLGAGAIGLAIAQLARAEGAGRVTLVGTRPRPLEVARSLGIEATVDLGADEAPPTGAAVVFETAGGPDMLERALAAVEVGGTIGLVGESFDAQAFDPTAAMERELTIAFVWSHDGRDEFARALDLAASGAVVLAPAVTHHFGLDEIADAFATASDRGRSGAIKVMIRP